MYFVKYGNEYLHDPRIDGRMLLDLSLDCEENSCGFCDFTIYPDHPLYNKLRERDADNPVEVYDDGILLFAGFIYELGKEFYLDGHVKCKGELDYLSETIIRPYSTIAKGYGSQAPNTVKEYFNWLIGQHNDQANGNKQFVIGENQVAALSTELTIFEESLDYPSTIDEIKNKLLEVYGGYLVTRHENGIRYIDYLSEWTESNSQILDFGVNLTDYTQTDDAVDVATFVIPLGAKMSETEYEYDNGYSMTSDASVNPQKEYYTESDEGFLRCEDLSRFETGITYYEFIDQQGHVQSYYGYYITQDELPNSEKEYYTRKTVIDGYSKCNELTKFKDNVNYYEYDENEDESDLPLTPAVAPDGRYGEPGYVKSNDIIYCEDAVKKYGVIGCIYKNDDIIDATELINAGTISLKERVSPKRTIEIKAVDMHLVNPSIKPIRIGEYVRVRSNPHGLDSYFLCASIDLDLNNPESSLYTLGTTFDTLTGQQNKKINELNASINRQYEKVESSLVAEAITRSEEANKLAGNAYTKATEAESTANTIVTTVTGVSDRVSSVETSVSDLSASVTSQFSEVEQTSSGISIRVGTVETDLNDLVIGGRNLYLETRNFSGTSWNNLEYWYEVSPRTSQFVEYGRNGSWMGLSQSIDVVEGEQYTFSFYAKGDANALVHVYTDQDSSSTTPDHIVIGPVSMDRYTRYSATFTTNVTGTINPRVENTTDSLLQVCGLKLELGNRPTDWTPAPEDAESGITDAKKTATDYLGFSTDGLTVGDMKADQLGKNVNISGEGVKIRNGSTVLASFTPTEIDFDQPVIFQADGIMLDNGDAFSYLGRNNILWTHATGKWMVDSINLSSNITRQVSGVVFAWSYFVNGAPQDTNWRYFFVPKSHVTNHPGAGVYMTDAFLGMNKYIYVSNSNASGVASNSQTGTTNGIAWNNANYVLRYVIGV